MVKAKTPSRSADGGPEPSGGCRMAPLFLCGRGGNSGWRYGQPARTKKSRSKKHFAPADRRLRDAVPIKTGCGIPAGNIRFVSGMFL